MKTEVHSDLLTAFPNDEYFADRLECGWVLICCLYSARKGWRIYWKRTV